MALKLKTPAATLPLSLQDAKEHLRVEHDSDDREILMSVQSATAWAENHTGRSFIEQTWRIGARSFAKCFVLDRLPLISVESITYVDTDGAGQTLATDQYLVDDMAYMPVIYPAFGVSWPTARDQANSVIIEFKSGYGAKASRVPGDIISAIKLITGHLFENREQNIVGVGSSATQLPFRAEDLLRPYRVLGL